MEMHEAAFHVIFGNLMMVLIYLAVDFQHILSSGAVYGFVPLLLLMAGIARTYIHLRKRARPKDVSRKRIRTIVISSFILGALWAVITSLAMPAASPLTAVVLIMGR